MVETSTAIEIFCSYAHEDEVWLRKLETHLSLLKRQGLISLWHDRLIVTGHTPLICTWKPPRSFCCW